jgi:hypothetical protein
MDFHFAAKNVPQIALAFESLWEAHFPWVYDFLNTYR